MTEPRHRWIVAPHGAGRLVAHDELKLPPVLAAVNAHRRLRGPYTAAGSILRALAPSALTACPAALARHDIEILTTAPELRAVVPASRETLTSLAVPKERTRFYSRLRTLRIAHGLVEFLTAYAAEAARGPRTLIVDDAHQADPTDREFLAVLLRRMDPRLLTVVVSTGAEPAIAPPAPHEDPLGAALTGYCVRHVYQGTATPEAADAVRFVDSDGTSDDPQALAAYEKLPAAERERLHDSRRGILEERQETSLRLGAIAWHAEHGSDPSGAGAAALRFALDHCMEHGFYDAVVDYGIRGRALVEYAEHPDHWWAFTSKRTIALAALGRPEQALPLYEDARAVSAEPEIHLQAAYATAMLYTRHFGGEHRDHQLARGWINEAIAFSTMLADPKDRAMRTAFNRNGLALVEVHQGRPQAALALLDQCIAALDASLEPHEHALHRSVLRYNRAQVNAGLGRSDEAIADYTAVIAADPNYAEYHFDRGIILRRTGRYAEALADFDEAIRLSPPFPEAYHNRADVRAELGDPAGAAADLGYVIELDPDFADAYLNRALLLLDAGDTRSAREDVEAGLAVAPDHAGLLTLRGQLHAAAGDSVAARNAYSAALSADPRFAQAWACRAELAYGEGDLDSAIADLEQAAALSDDPGIRFNLAVAYHDANRYARAVDLLDAVIDETGDPSAHLRRARSLLVLGRTAQARADLRHALDADPELIAEARELLPDMA